MCGTDTEFQEAAPSWAASRALLCLGLAPAEEGSAAFPVEGIQQSQRRESSIPSAYHGPLASFDPHLVVAALLGVQGAHEGADGRAPDHIHGNSSLDQRPDNAHLGAAPVPREGEGKEKPLSAKQSLKECKGW